MMTTRNTHEASIQTHVGMEIAKHYKLELTNIARGGRGPDRTTLTTMAYWGKNKPQWEYWHCKHTFALIEWSDAGRWDYPKRSPWNKKAVPGQDTDWQSLKMMEHPLEPFLKRHTDHIDIPAFHVLRFFHNVLCLQYFFKVHQIPYLMYNGLDNDIHTMGGKDDHRSLLNLVDKKHFFGLGEHKLCHCEWAKDRNFTISSTDHHPNQEGHKQFAKLLISYINENNLLKK